MSADQTRKCGYCRRDVTLLECVSWCPDWPCEDCSRRYCRGATCERHECIAQWKAERAFVRAGGMRGGGEGEDPSASASPQATRLPPLRPNGH